MPLPTQAQQGEEGLLARHAAPTGFLKSCQFNAEHAAQDYLQDVAVIAGLPALPQVGTGLPQLAGPASQSDPGMTPLAAQAAGPSLAVPPDPQETVLPGVLPLVALQSVPKMVISFDAIEHDDPLQTSPQPTYAGIPVSFVDPTLGFIVVPVPDLATAMLVQQTAADDPDVIDCDVSTTKTALHFPPDDPCYAGAPGGGCAGSQWYLDRMRVPDAWGPAAPGLSGANNRRLCIADSGFHMTHTDLAGVALAGSISYTPAAGGGTEPFDDDNVGHGTAMAGLALAAIHNGLHVAGITRQDLLAAKVLGASADMPSYTASAIAWCANNGANVISLSLGFDSDPGRVLKKAVEYAWARGALIFAAPPNDPALPVDFPGIYPQVVAVNCVDNAATPQKCATSPADSHVFLSAPANPDIRLLAPDASSMFGACGSPNNCRSLWPNAGNSGATAMAAGVAALVWGANTGLTNAQVKEILRCTAIDVGVTGTPSKLDTQTGWGMLDADAAIDAAQGTGACAPAAAAPATVWTETFEGAWTSSWYLGTTDGTAPMWHQHGGACVAAAQGSFSAGWTQSGPCTYNTGSVQRNWITSPWISLAGATTAELTFKTTFFIEMYGGSYDQLYVWIYDGSWHLEKAWDSSTPASGGCGASSSTCLTPWSLQTVSLTPYVGKDIFMSFDARTVDSLYNDFKGWYVDDVAVSVSAAGGPGPVVPSWHEDFELCGGPLCPGWVYVSGPTGVGGDWQVTGKKSFGSDPAKANALWYGKDASNTYETGSDANSGRAMANIDPTYPDIHVPATGAPMLQFRSWSEREYATYWDELRVEVSPVATGGWSCLASTYTVASSSNPCSGAAAIPYYPMAWDQLSYSLAAYAGQDVYIRFVFDTHDGLYNTYWGWFVDEVAVVN